MSNLYIYDSYVAGADSNDRRRFDTALAIFLLNEVDEATARKALDAAAAEVNR